ncbi:MAG: hypothetical protein GQE15_19235 [Archangiaceae bacterium]|nr:hypothetical protein [Archangiaceae bacterium]
MTDERGELIHEYPRTFSFKNWPFFVFLLFLAGVLATFATVAGNVKAPCCSFSVCSCFQCPSSSGRGSCSVGARR